VSGIAQTVSVLTAKVQMTLVPPEFLNGFVCQTWHEAAQRQQK